MLDSPASRGSELKLAALESKEDAGKGTSSGPTVTTTCVGGTVSNKIDGRLTSELDGWVGVNELRVTGESRRDTGLPSSSIDIEERTLGSLDRVEENIGAGRIESAQTDQFVYSQPIHMLVTHNSPS